MLKDIIIILVTIFKLISSVTDQNLNVTTSKDFNKTLAGKKSLAEEDKVIGGTEANKQDWQFIAAIVFGVENNYKYFHAIGSLIKPNMIITSAPAVLEEFIKHYEDLYGPVGVRLGPNKITYVKVSKIKPNSSDTTLIPAILKNDITIKVKEILVYPNRTRLHLSYIINDIALIKLEGSDRKFLPVDISRVPSENLTKLQCRTAGWLLKEVQNKVQSELREVKMTIYNKETCLYKISERLESAGFTSEEKIFYYNTKFCSLHSATNRLLLEEKGNPLICDNVLQGIALNFYHIHLENIYITEFEDVSPESSYYSWIRSQFTTTTVIKIERALTTTATSVTTSEKTSTTSTENTITAFSLNLQERSKLRGNAALRLHYDYITFFIILLHIIFIFNVRD